MTTALRFDPDARKRATIHRRSLRSGTSGSRGTVWLLSAGAIVLGAACMTHGAVGEDTGRALPLTGETAEQFLKTAKVLELKEFKTKGVTRPRKATLSDGKITLDAVFKDVDIYKEKEMLEGGEVVFHFRDSYRHEIAAYQLDKLLGLGMVPPCVRRRLGGSVGALCLWVEGTITEWDRLGKGDLPPPDMEAWDRQMMTVRLFLQLIADIDYRNVANLLVDEDFKIYKIDSSRAFAHTLELRDETELTRFSQSVIKALRDLTDDDVKTSLKGWLVKDQIKGLMARRDRILELAEARVAALGEDKVFYP